MLTPSTVLAQVGFDGTGGSNITIDPKHLLRSISLLQRGDVVPFVLRRSADPLMNASCAFVYNAIHARGSLTSTINALVRKWVVEEHHAVIPGDVMGSVLEADAVASGSSSYRLYLLNPHLPAIDMSTHYAHEASEPQDALWRSPQYWYSHDDGPLNHATDPLRSCVSSLWISNTSRTAFYDLSAGVCMWLCLCRAVVPLLNPSLSQARSPCCRVSAVKALSMTSHFLVS